MKISPSILGANFLELKKEIKKIKTANRIHLDIMDGHFVPNISFGPFISSLIAQDLNMPLDIHLMLSEPIDYIEKFCFSNTHNITIHSEANNVEQSIKKIKEKGIKAGLAINPNTNIQNILNLIDKIDLILVMSVEPGFGGQKFIDTTYLKVEQLNKIRKEQKLSFEIEVDGGVNLENALKLSKLGTDCVVVGSYLFKEKNKKKLINQFQKM